jgi:multidrug efflux system membrane fusion protein
VAAAQPADVPVVLDALGTVTPIATVTLRPQVSGVLQQVLFREGQLVRKGELLAQIDPRPFEIALQQAVGTRQRDEAQLENARLTLQRYETLLTQDSIARQDVDTQAALVRQLEGTVTTDRAAEANARLNLSYTRIVSPVAGRIGLRQVDPGNLVGSNDANGLVVITQVSPVDVAFAVPQDRVPEVQSQAAKGTLPARALDRSRSQVLAEGRFWTLDNQVDVQTGTVRAKARFDNADGSLIANQFVNLRLQLDLLKGVVTVPLSAVRQGAQGEFVFVVQADRTAQMRPIQRGPMMGERLAVLKGLQPGERVVTEGADRLRDGGRVVLPGEGAAGGRGPASAPEAGAPAASGEARPRRQRPPQDAAAAP